jgi:hypothetical protein
VGGTPTLTFFPSPNQELSDLSPVRLGRGTRYAMGFTITDIRKWRTRAGKCPLQDGRLPPLRGGQGGVCREAAG